MAHYSKIFDSVPIDVQNVSGFNLSHENLFSAKCGTLTPCFIYDCIPNTTLSLDVSAQIQLPPMATDFYGKIDAVFESFFVPYRLLYGGWQEFITHPTTNSVYPSGAPDSVKVKYLPFFLMNSVYLGAQSLADYLGFKAQSLYNEHCPIINPLRHAAYYKIWDDWYRNSFVQNPCFVKPKSLQEASVNNIAHLPFLSFAGDSAIELKGQLANGKDFGQLLQRNWSKDYFTTATPLPQAGTTPSMTTFVQVEDKVTFNWSQLSALNTLNRWEQINNIAGYRYSDQMLARFGCLPPDSIMDRAIYLGRQIIPVYTKSVFKTNEGDTATSNPFSTVGSKYGSSQGVGSGSLINKYHAKEHGVFMTLFSLVPRAYYSTGLAKQLFYQKSTDFPDPLFANMGDQPIYNYELNGYPAFGEHVSTFGYQQRFSEYKYIDDQVHGLLKDGENLESFALQRSFDTVPDLSSEFLQIPTNYLDQVTAVSEDSSKYGCWVDAYFKCTASMPLPAYSLPTLTDPKDVHTIVVPKGGRTMNV